VPGRQPLAKNSARSQLVVGRSARKRTVRVPTQGRSTRPTGGRSATAIIPRSTAGGRRRDLPVGHLPDAGRCSAAGAQPGDGGGEGAGQPVRPGCARPDRRAHQRRHDRPGAGDGDRDRWSPALSRSASAAHWLRRRPRRRGRRRAAGTRATRQPAYHCWTVRYARAACRAERETSTDWTTELPVLGARKVRTRAASPSGRRTCCAGTPTWFRCRGVVVGAPDPPAPSAVQRTHRAGPDQVVGGGQALVDDRRGRWW
jgi:hypothetical protein